MIKGFPHAIGKLHLRSCFTDVSVMLHPHTATDATNRRYMRDEAQAGQKAGRSFHPCPAKVPRPGLWASMGRHQEAT